MSKIRLQGGCSDSSDCSASDEECYAIDHDRYLAASISDGLRNRQFRVSALRELQEVVTKSFKAASKKVQHAIYNDLMVAVQQIDSSPLNRSRLRVAEATTALVTAAKRVLPQQRRMQLIKEHKQAAVACKRSARKHTDEAAADDDDGCEAAAMCDMPPEVVQLILESLDPISLAAASCVCRHWCSLATKDEMWQQHLQLMFQVVARQPNRQQHDSQQGQSPGHHLHEASPQHSEAITHNSRDESGAYHSFRRGAQRHPRMLLPWRSCRALLRGRLQWLPAGEVYAPRAAAAARAARRGVLTPGPIYVDHEQAVSWMMGKPWSEVLRNSCTSSSSGASSDDDSSSDGEESHSHVQALRLWAVPRSPI